MSKRSVRLKEFIPNEKKFMYADRFYDQYPDLERRLCYYTEADKNGFVVTGNGHFSYNKLRI